MPSMLRKKETLVIITPIPGFIPRQLAIDILHSHGEVITLNPLVLEHKPIKAPRDAASDEFYSTWYEITERIQYLPGLGKMGSGKISFNGCFHDMPWGLQTHIYAPMNIDLRNKYRICGNQPGVEPPETLEMGLEALGAPKDGLYLREDIEIKANVTMISFVKAQLKAAGKEMVSRIIKKAELLDAGVLHAMIEDGKLKTVNPLDRSHTVKSPQPQPSPSLTYQPSPSSPGLPYQIPRPQSMQYTRPGSQGQGYTTPTYPYAQPHQQHVQELAAPEAPPSAPIEMPGDFYHPQVSPHLQPPPGAASANRDSKTPTRWSAQDYAQPQLSPSLASSRPNSIQSSVSGGFPSPGLPDHKLATHSETNEEHRAEALKRLDPSPGQQGQQQPQRGYSYNPADYVKHPMGQQVTAGGQQKDARYTYPQQQQQQQHQYPPQHQQQYGH